MRHAALRFNRNIVECKAARFSYALKPAWVLIETLWNVKNVSVFVRMFSGLVLIETLWNVKFISRHSVENTLSVLIETLWNVKMTLHQFG